MSEDLKQEARDRTYDHYGNPPAKQISKDIDYYIDKARAETIKLERKRTVKLTKEAFNRGINVERDRCAKIVRDWVKEDTKMPEYMKSAIQGLLTAIAKTIEKGMIEETYRQDECDCCGWDDYGYTHEPNCATKIPNECFCQSYYDDNNVLQDCTCGKCTKAIKDTKKG